MKVRLFGMHCLIALLGALGVSQLVDGKYVEETFYPTPNATGSGGWSAAFEKAKAFVVQMSLTEKAFMVTGVDGPCVGNIPAIPRLGFQGICLQDGPLAIRQVSYASVFPAGVSVAATWDAGLMYQRGMALGQEFVGKGANIMLGPVAGPLGRSALGGRNWEGFSPDPYLTGVAFSQTIIGAQSQGIQACAKHYIAYEQETQRNPSVGSSGETIEAVSSNLDDQTMHELYLWPFAEAVKSGVASIMCSYNRINETYACSNSKTLNGILKTELGFQGSVVSDWGAVHAGVATVLAGLDVNMPGPASFEDSTLNSFWGYNLTEMIKNGSVPESRLNDMIIRTLMPYYDLGQDSLSYPTVDIDTAQINSGMTGNFLPSYTHQFNLGNFTDAYRDVRGNNYELIHEIGAASAVLLKNTNNALPLKSPKRIAVFGNGAADLTGGPYDPQNEIGPQAVGGGSGAGRFTYIIPPLDAIKQRVPNSLVQYITDNTLVTGTSPSGSQLYSVFPEPDVCLIFLKTYATEGSDLTSLLCDWDSSDVVTGVAFSGFCPNTIVVTNSPGPNIMPWASNENVTGIIAAHYPGEQIGNAIVDVLFGSVNPSAKLPYTIAKQASDYNAPITNLSDSSNPNSWQSNFTEGLLIDYHHFDSADIEPLYEFGFGLSYTNFSLSKVGVSKTSIGAADVGAYPPRFGSHIPPPGGNPALYDVLATVAFTVTNTGSVAGATVPQLYLSFPKSEIPTAPKVLRGFERTTLLDPGNSTTLTFQLRRKDLSSWDADVQQWKIPSGRFKVLVGWSSRDLPESKSLSFL